MDIAGNQYRDTLPEGYQLHWYQLKSVIGRGGYGITYLAHDNNLDQPVAIKEYLPVDFATRLNDDTVHPMSGEQQQLFEWGLNRFIAEARTLAKFKHPNIVTVHSVFEHNQTAYMVMEYAKGIDLSEVYKKSSEINQRQYLDTFLPIIDGLSLVHESGFIHRDIKPANIYIRKNGSPLLLDFGSARQSMGSTNALTSLVTFGYAPYEQFSEGDGKQGPWTDIYGLGASLYVGITGKKPIDALKRVSGILEEGIDPYEPVSLMAPSSLMAKENFSDNFLLAIDYALRFKANDRPKQINVWADMLSDKTESPGLLSEMIKQPDVNEEKTVIRPYASLNTSQSVSVPQSVSRPTSQSVTGDLSQSGMQPESNVVSNGHITNIVLALIRVSKNYIYKIHLQPKQWINHVTKAYKHNNKLVHKLTTAAISLILVIAVTPLIFNALNKKDDIKQASQSLKQQKIEEYLQQAEKLIIKRKFIGKSNSNALYFYLKASELEPSSEYINTAISQVIEQVEKSITQEINNSRLDSASEKLSIIQYQLPDVAVMSNLHEMLDQKKTEIEISSLIGKANKAVSQKNYINKDNNGAYAYYQKVMILDENNKMAQQGIVNIKKKLTGLIEESVRRNKLHTAQKYIGYLKEIDASNSDLAVYQSTINTLKRKQLNIANLLKAANNLYRNGNLTRPKDKNALQKFRKVLVIDSSNQKALKGISRIRNTYLNKFTHNIESKRYTKAQEVLNTISDISPDYRGLNEMQKNLNQKINLQKSMIATRKETRPEVVVEDIAVDKSNLEKTGDVVSDDDNKSKQDKSKSIPIGTFF